MSLFKFKKNKENSTASECPCAKSSGADETSNIQSDCCSDCKISSIKVLGAGCKTCHEQFENVKKAAAKINSQIKVEYITDMQQVMQYGVMSMPAIVVNESVVSTGKVLKPSEVEKLLQKLG